MPRFHALRAIAGPDLYTLTRGQIHPQVQENKYFEVEHIKYIEPVKPNVLSGPVRTVKALIRLRLHCPHTESLDTTECMNGEQRPGWYFAHAQDNLNLRMLRMFEGIFSLDADHIIYKGQLNNKQKKQNSNSRPIIDPLTGHPPFNPQLKVINIKSVDETCIPYRNRTDKPGQTV